MPNAALSNSCRRACSATNVSHSRPTIRCAQRKTTTPADAMNPPDNPTIVARDILLPARPTS